MNWRQRTDNDSNLRPDPGQRSPNPQVERVVVTKYSATMYWPEGSASSTPELPNHEDSKSLTSKWHTKIMEQVSMWRLIKVETPKFAMSIVLFIALISKSVLNAL